MYRLIACDMDETLLNSSHDISDMDADSIRKAVSEGIKFVIATGRGYNSVQHDLKKLGILDEPGQYVISYNGAIITENKNNRVISFEGLDFQTASELFELGKGKGVCIHVYTEDTVYVYNYVDEERKYIEGRMNIVEFFDDNIDFLKGQPIGKVLFMSFDKGLLKKIDDIVSSRYSHLEISYSSNRYIEFNRKGINKGFGLIKLAEILNIPLAETIVVGDNVNDLPMIKAAGLGIGVNNSHKDILNDIDVLLEHDNNHDPLTEVIERFIEKKES